MNIVCKFGQVSSHGVGNAVDLTDVDIIARGIVDRGVENVEVVGSAIHEAEFGGNAVTGIVFDGGVVFGAVNCG